MMFLSYKENHFEVIFQKQRIKFFFSIIKKLFFFFLYFEQFLFPFSRFILQKT